MEVLDPSRKFDGRIGCSKDSLSDCDHAGARVENSTSRCEGNACRSTQDCFRPRLLAKTPHAVNADWLLVCVLGSRFKNGTDGEIVHGSFENSGQESVASTESAHNAVRPDKAACLNRSQVARIDMDSIKLRLLNQISPVIENQLCLFAGHCGAKNCGVGQDLGCRTGLVAVLEEGDACIGQRHP